MTALTPNDRFISLSPAPGTTVLAYDFELMLPQGMTVIRIRAGLQTQLVLGVDFSFPGGIGNETGGTLTLAAGSLAGDVYLLIGAQPEQRLSDFVNSQKFDSAKMNADLDALTMVAQEHRRDISRSWKSAYGTAGGQITAGADGELLKFEQGNIVGSAENVDDILGSTAAAIAARDAARKWATEAEDVGVNDGVNPAGFSAFNWMRKALVYAATASAAAIAAAASAASINLPPMAPNTMLVAKPDGSGYAAVSYINLLSFGAKGDGVTDDTAAIQAALNAAGTRKCAVYAPGGRYVMTAEATLPQMATTISGDGPMLTVFIQKTAGANGFKFVASGGNSQAGNFALIKTVHFERLSLLCENGISAGVAIWCEWGPATNNQSYFSLDNVQIYTNGNTNGAWTKGIYLLCCNGLTLNNFVIKGNDNNEPAINLANPFTMTQAIHLDGTLGVGQINAYISNGTTGASGDALLVDDWFEGVFMTNVSFVHHHTGIRYTGNGGGNVPLVLNLVNCHFDTRYRALDLYQVFKLHAVNCDILTAGTFANHNAHLASCMHWEFIGCNFSGGASVAIDTDAGCYRGIAQGNLFQSSANGIVLRTTSEGALIQGNEFYGCTNGILLDVGASGHKIGVNKFSGAFTNRILNNSGNNGNEIVPFKYARGNTTVGGVFAGAAVTQTVTVAIPTGVFIAAPTAGFLTCTTAGEYWVARYDPSTSTATSGVFQVQRSTATSIPAGTYSYCATFESLA